MTENLETPENGPETAVEPSNEAEGTQTPETGNKAAQEAKKYRLQLREAESKLEALNTQLETLRTAEVLRVAGDALEVPQDLYALTGTTLADYLTEDGTVDAKAVQKAAADLIKSRPGLRKSDLARDPTQGYGRGQVLGGSPSWEDLFRK